MAALAVFSSCANSHPFQDRRVNLTESQKIGRSVAQARPSPNNAVFDCKVLSRNHALIWYDNGKFYLQDTKSSNGTFVNSQRLSKGSEESEPREIFSGDTVQFGVDVMENSLTHSCIIASIRLYFPDGQEAINSHSNSFGSNSNSAVNTLQSQELYQLAQFLQEALHREQVLENKLTTLQRLVQSTQEASETGWQALIDEDRLLSRLEVLERQLTACTKNEDSVRKELVTLHEDKFSYETTAKESLRKVLEEKLEAVQRILELERSLNNAEEDRSHLQTACQTAENELQALAERYQDQLSEVRELMDKLQESEKKHQDKENELEKEKQELQNQIDSLLSAEESLQAKIESLQADYEFTTEQLNNLKVKLDTMKKYSSTDSPKIQEFSSFHDQAVQADLVNLLDLQMLQGGSDDESDEYNSDDGDENESEEFSKKEQSSKGEKRKKKSGGLDISKLLQNGINTKQGDDSELDVLQKEYKRQSNDSSLDVSSTHLPHQPISAQYDLSSSCQSNECSALVSSLTAEIERFQGLLTQSNEALSKANSKIEKLQGEISTLRSQLSPVATTPIGYELPVLMDLNTDDVKGQVAVLREQLEKAEKDAKYSHIEVEQLRDRVRGLQEELEYERLRLSTVSSVGEGAQENVAGEGDTEGGRDVNTVQNEIQKELARNRAEFTVLKEECASLRQRIQDIETEMKMSRLENYQLKEEYGRLQASYRELEQMKAKLQSSESEWQNNLTDAQKEADNYKEQLAGIKEKMKHLEARYTERQSEIDKLRRQLDSNPAVDTAIVRTTAAAVNANKANATTNVAANTDAAATIVTGKEELEVAAAVASDETDSVDAGTTKETERADDEYAVLALQCRTVSVMSMVPLLMLLLAFLLAFLPFLSTITATFHPPTSSLPSGEQPTSGFNGDT